MVNLHSNSTAHNTAMSLSGFSQLTADIHLYSPVDASPGHLVILCTWMGALDKHIAKYIALHKALIPSASILLLKSHVGSMISPYKSQQRALSPATLPVFNLLMQCQQDNVAPQILLHIFSNGGINSATHLLINLERETRVPLPLVGIICDSVPTGAGYRKTYNAFMYSFPTNFPLSPLAAALAIHTLLILLFLSVALGRYEHPEDFWRGAILDAKLVGGCRRIAYVASKADKLTGWRDVVEHAEVARGSGWGVRQVILEGTGHCNHLSGEPGIYGEVVEAMWEGVEL